MASAWLRASSLRRSASSLLCAALVTACGARTIWVPGDDDGAGGSAPQGGRAGSGGSGIAGQPPPGRGGVGGGSGCGDCEFLAAPECHRFVCDQVSASCVLVGLDGVSCIPGDPCELNGTCIGGTCVGTPMMCPTPVCSQGGLCLNGACSSGAPLDCSAFDSACTVGWCDTGDGQCKEERLPHGTLCDDQNACTQGDACASGVCGGTLIQSCTSGDGCCPVGCSLGIDADCGSAFEFQFDAVHRGWWSTNVGHESALNNTFTGWSDGTYNSYFIFDLGGVIESVVAATLQLEYEGSFGAGTETASIWDVSTDAATLEASGSAFEVVDDLQSGNSYGSFGLSPDQLGTVLTIALNAQAVNDLNAAAGGLFAVGVHLDTVEFGSEEGVRFSETDEARVHRLVVQLQ